MRLFTQNAKIEALRQAPLFQGLSKKELRELARVTEDLAVEAGTVLCREGRLGREFYVIVDGVAEVTKGGKRLVTRKAGEFFGEIALLTTMKRTATVTAKTSLRCFMLMSGNFYHVLDKNPQVQRKIMKALAQRLLSYSGDPML